MSKPVLFALILIGITALVLVFNTVGVLRTPHVEVELWFASIKMMKAVAFFVFTVIGVVIGLLLK